ncbi:MAG: pyridoxal phosphate-dependent aminotransferase [Planctomycetota bacterium]|jgi:histidinol-phosphate aminotransferase
MTPQQSGPTPSPYAAAVRTYRPPAPLTPTDLHLSSNEGMLLAADWLDVLGGLPGEAISGYPSAAGLEAVIAEAFGLDVAQVLAGTGGDDVVERALRAYLCLGRTVILNEPSFVMLNRYAALAGGEPVALPWSAGPLPVDDMLAAVDETTAMIVVVSPNNPTGLIATADDLGRLRDGAPSAMLLVDLAYGEFADEDLTAVALSLPNTIVIRSFSKAWGLAGLRVGWAAGPPDVIEQLRAVGHPYPVSAPSAAIVTRMVRQGRPIVEGFIRRIRDHRRQLADVLIACGADVTPSQANFLLSRFDDATWVRDALAGMGIAVRAFPDVPVLHDRLRITVPGDEGQLARLCGALKTVLRPQRVLIDSRAPEADELVSQLGDRDDGLAVATSDIPSVQRIAADANMSRCWLVGIDIDAVCAARQTGILPLGVATPDGPESRDLLLAGAGRVLTDLCQLEELLP